MALGVTATPSVTLTASNSKAPRVLLINVTVIDLDTNDKKDDSPAEVPPPEGGDEGGGGGCGGGGRSLTERGCSEAAAWVRGGVGTVSDRKTVTLMMQCGGWP